MVQCGERDDAFTHRQHGNEEKGKKSQLDHKIGFEERYNDIFIYKGHKAWATWHHYFIFAWICENDWGVPLKKKRNR